MDAAVQTSEREPDLFVREDQVEPRAAAAPSAPDCALAFTGRLADKPHVASKPADAVGHFHPVLVLDLHEVGPARQRLTAHVPYTDKTRDAAEALAKSLQRGDTVTVRCALSDVRLFLAAAIVIPTPQE